MNKYMLIIDYKRNRVAFIHSDMLLFVNINKIKLTEISILKLTVFLSEEIHLAKIIKLY